MSEDRIERKDLWPKLRQIKIKDWIKAAETLNLKVTTSKGGTSHSNIRFPNCPENDIRGLVTTINEGMSRQSNEKVFKRFLKCGFSEDAIWKALKII